MAFSLVKVIWDGREQSDVSVWPFLLQHVNQRNLSGALISTYSLLQCQFEYVPKFTCSENNFNRVRFHTDIITTCYVCPFYASWNCRVMHKWQSLEHLQTLTKYLFPVRIVICIVNKLCSVIVPVCLWLVVCTCRFQPLDGNILAGFQLLQSGWAFCCYMFLYHHNVLCCFITSPAYGAQLTCPVFLFSLFLFMLHFCYCE